MVIALEQKLDLFLCTDSFCHDRLYTFYRNQILHAVDNTEQCSTAQKAGSLDKQIV